MKKSAKKARYALFAGSPSIKYSRNKAKKRKSAEINLQNHINELYKKAETLPKQIINEIYDARLQLENIMHYKTKGTILRSKVR